MVSQQNACPMLAKWCNFLKPMIHQRLARCVEVRKFQALFFKSSYNYISHFCAIQTTKTANPSHQIPQISGILLEGQKAFFQNISPNLVFGVEFDGDHCIGPKSPTGVQLGWDLVIVKVWFISLSYSSNLAVTPRDLYVSIYSTFVICSSTLKIPHTYISTASWCLSALLFASYAHYESESR